MLTCHNSWNQEIFMFNEMQCWEKAKMNEEAREWTPFPESPALKKEKKKKKKNQKYQLVPPAMEKPKKHQSCLVEDFECAKLSIQECISAI